MQTTALAYSGSVDFPELFKYNAQKNVNLENALLSISISFKDNSVPITQELLAAIMATLDKEVGGSYLPVEEQGDYGMGLGSTYTAGGSRRSTPYDGGVDYKGRGYIQITGKSNYQTYCGSDCVGTSTPELDVCGCKNQQQCTVTDAATCPQVKAFQPDYAAKIFASYYLKNGLVSLSNAKSYNAIGKAINGGDEYASDFDTKANAYLTLFINNPDKTNKLLRRLSTSAAVAGALIGFPSSIVGKWRVHYLIGPHNLEGLCNVRVYNDGTCIWCNLEPWKWVQNGDSIRFDNGKQPPEDAIYEGTIASNTMSGSISLCPSCTNAGYGSWSAKKLSDDPSSSISPPW